MDQFSTGIVGLDRELDGGIPPGTLVAIETDPASQGSSLLQHLAIQQPTLYIQTRLTGDEVELWLQDEQLVPEESRKQVEYTGIEQGISEIYEYLDGLTEPVNIVIDPVNRLESASEDEYLGFLRNIRSHIQDTGRVCYLHILDCDRCDPDDDCPHCAETYRVADMVWKVTATVTEDTNNTLLAVTKRRAGATPDAPLEVEFGEEITVDTSRNISV